MIVFDLQCAPTGHVFEAWFGSSEDYEAQRTRGLVACPLCGASDVEKAVMAPRLAPKGNRSAAAAGEMMTSDVEGMKQALAAMAAAQRKLLESSEHVGDRFADEARAIHLGESEQRAIHGRATPDQARSLMEEGVPVAPLPLPVIEPGREN